MDIEQGVGVALGLTIDVDKDVVILIVVGTEDHQIAAPMTPGVAFALGSSMKEMAVACLDLQERIGNMSDEEIRAELEAIQKRFAAPTN